MNTRDWHSLSVGDYLPCRAEATGSLPGFLPVNIVNGFGMSGLSGVDDTHDSHHSAITMWLGRHDPAVGSALIFDFGSVVPVGSMLVWNFNRDAKAGEPGPECGFRDVTIDTSVDRRRWTPLHRQGVSVRLAMADASEALAATNQEDGAPIDFDGRSARYVRLRPAGGVGVGNWGGKDAGGSMLVGLSEVRFYAGEGLMVERDPDWTSLLKRNEGWTGADGIFAIPFNGDERVGGGQDTSTLFLFSDTFVGKVDPTTAARTYTMLNNTISVLEGGRPSPDKMRFIYRTDDAGRPGNIFDPAGKDHFTKAHHYFWLQDGIILGDKLWLTALNVFDDPEGPEGLAFRVGEVTMISCPMSDNGPNIDRYELISTPLQFDRPDGGRGFYGCGILPNTQRAGAPDPDGFIYVYGYINKAGTSDLIVARVKEESFPDFSVWRYFSSDGWSSDPSDSVVVAKNVSHEISVSPYSGRLHQGKYILIFQRDIAGHIVGYRIGTTPFGPFGESQDIFHTEEWEQGYGITTYNAKAHPHLSEPGDLLVSYNVNSIHMASHVRDGYIYRPRFIRLREVVGGRIA